MKKKISAILIVTWILSLIHSCTGDDTGFSGSQRTEEALSGNASTPVAQFLTQADKTRFRPGEIIRFTNCSFNADRFTWEFGDGVRSYEKDPVHVYESPGTYRVELTAWHNNTPQTVSRDLEIAYLIEDQVRSIVEEYQETHKYPGISVAIMNSVQREHITATAGYSHQNIRISDQMLFAAPTSPMTMALCLRMLDEGIFSLDDPIGRYLEKYPHIDSNITIRHLLFHQSGLYDVLRSRSLDRAMNANMYTYWSTEALMEYMEPPLSPPGKEIFYCWFNTYLLALVLEYSVGDGYYQRLYRRYVTNPLGLNDTYMAIYDSFDYERLANPWAPSESRNYFSLTHLSVNQGHMGIVSTASDLAILVHAMFGTAFLSAESRTILTTRINPERKDKYGNATGDSYMISPGFFWNDTKKMYVMGHWLISGFLTLVAYFPENQTAIAILENGGTDYARQEQLAQDLADLF